MGLNAYENGEETVCKMQTFFKNNKRTRQLAKYCAKYLDNCKKLSQETKCEHGRQRSYCRIVREAKFMSLKKRNVGHITNWSLVEAPFLKT